MTDSMRNTMKNHVAIAAAATTGFVAKNSGRSQTSLAAQAAIGVTHVQLRFSARSSNEVLDQVAAFGSEVLPLTRS